MSLSNNPKDKETISCSTTVSYGSCVNLWMKYLLNLWLSNLLHRTNCCGLQFGFMRHLEKNITWNTLPIMANNWVALDGVWISSVGTISMLEFSSKHQRYSLYASLCAVISAQLSLNFVWGWTALYSVLRGFDWLNCLEWDFWMSAVIGLTLDKFILDLNE